MPQAAARSARRTFRIETRAQHGVDRRLTAAARALGFPGVEVHRSDLVFVHGELDDAAVDRLADRLLADPLTHRLVITELDAPTIGAGPVGVAAVVETARRPGVTDPVATELVRAANQLGLAVSAAATGTRYELLADRLDADRVAALSRRLLVNPVVEIETLRHLASGGTDVASPPGFVDDIAETSVRTATIVPITGLDDHALLALGRERGLALDPAELHAIADWYRAERREPTDVELETLAQTWSEHCAHKTFRARITTTDGTEVTPLLQQLRALTDELARPWVVSAFVGNAGIVGFTDGERLAIKVETHNHPSAVEPFGGANTGVGGVLRDVLAAPATPVAVTDVLCFGPTDLDPASLPAGVLHPAVIEEGVVAGVADYGNKLGVPNVAGAVLYDPGYTANPLVFCGCVGRVHAGADALDGPHPGDRVVVVGGATGRDGIRGATFSSMTMDATTGEVAGASVQIGDPITEKLVSDLLTELLDRPDPLCSALTDCGAGGLSSAVGEMADGIGADVELSRAPRKYPGLEPWEVWLSEAQERMVLAVPPARMRAVEEACMRHGVLVADLGAFTGDEVLVVRNEGTEVLRLPTGFLHDGRPTRQLVAELPAPSRVADGSDADRRAALVDDPSAVLLRLLAHPDIASKQAIVHRYDHEVLGGAVVRPLTGPERDGPSDGTVTARPLDAHGFALGVGVNPWFGLYDPERMAHAAVDEAIRNVVVAGADPDRVALLDNFSWGDPRRPSTLGALVATVQGCCDAARSHDAPYVSGKDSLNNEYEGVDGQRHSIPPTLVITALAHVPVADRAVTTDPSRPGDLLVLLGSTRPELRGSHLDLVLGSDHGGVVPAPDATAPQRYRGLHRAILDGIVRAAHDCSEGGIAVALAEMAIASRLGIDVHLDGTLDTATPLAPHAAALTSLFSESNGRLVVAVAPEDLDRLRTTVPGPITVLGTVTADPTLRIATGDRAIDLPVEHCRSAWQRDDAEGGAR